METLKCHTQLRIYTYTSYWIRMKASEFALPAARVSTRGAAPIDSWRYSKLVRPSCGLHLLQHVATSLSPLPLWCGTEVGSGRHRARLLENLGAPAKRGRCQEMEDEAAARLDQLLLPGLGLPPFLTLITFTSLLSDVTSRGSTL